MYTFGYISAWRLGWRVGGGNKMEGTKDWDRYIKILFINLKTYLIKENRASLNMKTSKTNDHLKTHMKIFLRFYKHIHDLRKNMI